MKPAQKSGCPEHAATPAGAVELAGGIMREKCHICAFFHGPDEEYGVLMPFIQQGLERGEKAFHVVDPQLRDDHLDFLQSAGIETGGLQRSGQLELCNWNEVYLRDGYFDPERMLGMLQSVLDGAAEQGFPMTRLIAHMEWALQDRPGVNALIEYECRLNFFLHEYTDPVICAYDLRKFNAETIIDILRTHPMVILGNVLQENPFYVPPEDFLRLYNKP